MTDNLKQADAIMAFTRLIQDISALESGQQVLEEIISTILKLSGAQRACLFMYGENSNPSLQIIASGGAPADIEHDHIKQKIAALALKKQKIIHLDDAKCEECLEEFYDAIQSIKSILCIPVSFRKHIKAVLYLDNSDSSFSVPDEIFPVINALMIQAVTEIILHPEMPDGKAGIDPERFYGFCESYYISKKEKQVLLLLLKGYTKKRIAEERSISINTVKHHISNIYDKTGAASREELANIFILRQQAI